MNWKELKDFCNSLTEEQLEKKVIMWREEEAISDIGAIVLNEDHYIDTDNDDNGCFTESDAKKLIEEDEDAYPEGMDEFKKVYDKGHPLLQENF